MRRSKSEAAETRRRIVETAASEFKRSGIQATALADVMEAAGLTQGGFYRHFDSKDQLVGEAVEAGMKPVAGFAKAAAADHKGKPALRNIVESYLSREHRGNRSGGCALAALGTELARTDDRTRAIAAKAILELVDVVAEQYEVLGEERSRGQAFFAISALVGALTLSRIVADPRVAGDILRSTVDRLVPDEDPVLPSGSAGLG